MECLPLDLAIFRVLALKAVDALLAVDAGGSLARRAHAASEYRALFRSSTLASNLPTSLYSDLKSLPEEKATPDAARRWLALPEQLAAGLGRHLVFGIDEVQELASLSAARFEPFPVSWGWRWAIAAVDEGGGVRLLGPAKAREGRELRVTEDAMIENVLRWMDAGPRSPARRVSRRRVR